VSGDDHGAASGFVVSFAAGSRIAGYRLEEQIGHGGMAVVFRARDEQLGRLVALKILAPALAGDAEFQRRFTSESRAAAAIDDSHIVPVFAAGEADGMLFIAMRYVAGGDAQSLLNREGPLLPERVAAIISPVASALDAAHRAGLVHRDVKPSNMLVDALPGRPDHVYLSDFGISKVAASTSGITTTGTVLGTLGYMSPEQIRGQPVDGRADQYALACSAFELLAGAVPFQRDEPTAELYAHLSESPPPLTSRRPGLSPVVNGVLSKALAKAPGDRYPSCGQFADALRDALGVQPYRSGPGARPAQTVPPAITPPAVPPVVTPPAPPTVIPSLVQEVPPPPPGRDGAPTESVALPGVTSPHPGWRNRRPLLAAIAVTTVVVLYLAVAAVAHTPPFAKSTPPLAGPTHPATAAASPSLPPGVASLTQLLPSDIDDPATQCQAHTPPFHVPGLAQSLTCIDPGLPGGDIFAYQANGPANYQTAFLNFNIWSAFYISTAGSTCPPAGRSKQAQGTTPWHDNYFPSRTGQVLECQWASGQPTYIWTFPTEDAFIVAVGATTFSALDSWWRENQQPLTSPSPATP
jgi:serine/threonine protein kinase